MTFIGFYRKIIKQQRKSFMTSDDDQCNRNLKKIWKCKKSDK